MYHVAAPQKLVGLLGTCILLLHETKNSKPYCIFTDRSRKIFYICLHKILLRGRSKMKLSYHTQHGKLSEDTGPGK